MNLKISFDFDGTLEYQGMQDIAKKLISMGYSICILTTRYSDTSNYSFEASNNDLYVIANELGITEIIFTEYRWKYETIDKYNINLHIDDNYHDEVIPINIHCKAKALHYDVYQNIKAFTKKLYETIATLSIKR